MWSREAARCKFISDEIELMLAKAEKSEPGFVSALAALRASFSPDMEADPVVYAGKIAGARAVYRGAEHSPLVAYGRLKAAQAKGEELLAEIVDNDSGPKTLSGRPVLSDEERTSFDVIDRATTAAELARAAAWVGRVLSGVVIRRGSLVSVARKLGERARALKATSDPEISDLIRGLAARSGDEEVGRLRQLLPVANERWQQLSRNLAEGSLVADDALRTMRTFGARGGAWFMSTSDRDTDFQFGQSAATREMEAEYLVASGKLAREGKR